MNKSVTKFIKTVKRGFGKRSPEILLGIGIASGITTTVLAVKATPKALELLSEKRYEKYGDTLKDSQKHLDEKPVSKNEVIITGTGKQLCYDGISGRYFESDIQTIRAAVNKINETMVYEMYAALNDFYNEIGLSNTDMGDELGWNIDDGLLEISYGAMVANDGRPCITLEYHVAPRYDFAKLM